MASQFPLRSADSSSLSLIITNGSSLSLRIVSSAHWLIWTPLLEISIHISWFSASEFLFDVEKVAFVSVDGFILLTYHFTVYRVVCLCSALPHWLYLSWFKAVVRLVWGHCSGPHHSVSLHLVSLCWGLNIWRINIPISLPFADSMQGRRLLLGSARILSILDLLGLTVCPVLSFLHL